MQMMSVPTEAENSVDFALEEIISENGLKEKVFLAEVNDLKALSEENRKNLKKIGEKIITDSISKTLKIELLLDSQTNKYYKSILRLN
ncbi:MAG: hypothetical protein IJ717_10955 [Treponema sp.]|nr:hypothetical protein [Treponema sp.]